MGTAADPRADETPSRPVLVTRPAGRGERLASRLHELGFAVEHRPLLRFSYESGTELTHALEQLAAGGFTHLVVTSRTAAAALVAAAPEFSVPPSTRVVAVGEGTAAALAAAGVRADLVASGSGAALVDELPAAVAGDRVLFPASAAAAPTVAAGLTAKGYRVHQVTAYRPEPLELPAEVARDLITGGYGAIVLTSPMIARLAATIGIHDSTAVVTIGDPTSEAAHDAGLVVHVQAAAPSDEALARAVQLATARPGP